MLPVFIDLRGTKVVVFGGGKVGFRKASFFAEEAEVTVVSRSFCDEILNSSLKTLNGEVEKVMAGMIGEADIVVAATDSRELNERIVEESVRQGKWCNCATSPGDMIIPSVVQREGYTVAVSTMGRSPAMSRYLREVLDARLAPEYSAMIALQEVLRAEAKQSIGDQNERERLLWDVLGDEGVWERLRAGDREGARQRAEERMVGFH